MSITDWIVWPPPTRVTPPPTWTVIPITVVRPLSPRVTISWPVVAPAGSLATMISFVQLTGSSVVSPSVTAPGTVPKPKSLGTEPTLTPVRAEMRRRVPARGTYGPPAGPFTCAITGVPSGSSQSSFPWACVNAAIGRIGVSMIVVLPGQTSHLLANWT